MVKKATCNAKISEIENKYITTADDNKFTKNVVDNSTKNKNLVDKSAIAWLINNTDLDKQSCRTRLQSFESIYFRGKNHFENGGTQNYLICQLMYRYF